jgi:hypothetical protein
MSNQKDANGGWTSRPNTATPKIERHSEYRGNSAPDAARALRGTTTLEGIKQATEARRANSEAWSVAGRPGRVLPHRETQNDNPIITPVRFGAR